MTKLLQYIDKWFKKDKLASAHESWSDFDSYKMDESNSIEAYVSGFEKHYKKLSKHGIVIPDCVLAFLILDRVRLTSNFAYYQLPTIRYR